MLKRVRTRFVVPGNIWAAVLENNGGEVEGHVGVDGEDLGDVGVDLPDERDVLSELVGEPRTVVIVDLADQDAVLFQHGLRFSEPFAQRLPRLLGILHLVVRFDSVVHCR